jgi:hypothetical protein
MLALLRAVVSALKSAMLWIAETAWGICLLPLRLFAPPAGRSSVPHAPVRTAEPGPSVGNLTDGPSPLPDREPSPATAHDEAADAIRYLGKRQRQGSGAGNPPSHLSRQVRNWVGSLTDAEADSAICAGLARLSDHLSGRAPVEELPPVVRTEATDARRRAAALLRPREVQSPALRSRALAV